MSAALLGAQMGSRGRREDSELSQAYCALAGSRGLQGSRWPRLTPTRDRSQGTCFGLDDVTASVPQLTIRPARNPP